jgi:hypothetical protein
MQKTHWHVPVNERYKKSAQDINPSGSCHVECVVLITRVKD